MISLFLKFTFLVASCAIGAMGWGCAGHMLTAHVALLQLPDETKAFVNELAAFQEIRLERISSATELACWPDDMKGYTHRYSNWHYIDLCFNPAEDLKCPAPPTPNINVSLTAAREVFSNPFITDRATYAFWMSYVIHLVGDAHQPLHTTAFFSAKEFPEGDRGGNEYKVVYRNHSIRLHEWCDSIGGLVSGGFPSRPLAEHRISEEHLYQLAQSYLDLQKNLTQYGVTNPDSTGVSEWLEEGFLAASEYIYEDGKLPLHEPLTEAYIHSNRKLLQNKIALGGHRLALVLKELHAAVLAKEKTK